MVRVMMKLKECCCGCAVWVKYAVFVINFLVFSCGICLLIVGTWARLQKAKLGSVDNLTTDPAFYLLILGALVVVISALGWCGALRENVTLLKAFSVSIILLFLLEVLGGILTFVFLDKFQTHLENYLRRAVSIYQDDKDLQNALDYIQKTLKCCGVSSYDDWEYNMYYNCSSPSQFSCGVPASCCKPVYGSMASTSQQCGFKSRVVQDNQTRQSIYRQGCIGPIMKLLKENMLIVGLLAFVVGFTELLSVTFAHILIRHLVRSRRAWSEEEVEMTSQPTYDSVLHSH